MALNMDKSSDRFAFTDLTSLDNETQLMWTRDANLSGKAMTWDEADDYVKRLNVEKYDSFSDWRLPSKEGLETLLGFAKGEGFTTNFYN